MCDCYTGECSIDVIPDCYIDDCSVSAIPDCFECHCSVGVIFDCYLCTERLECCLKPRNWFPSFSLALLFRIVFLVVMNVSCYLETMFLIYFYKTRASHSESKLCAQN